MPSPRRRYPGLRRRRADVAGLPIPTTDAALPAARPRSFPPDSADRLRNELINAGATDEDLDLISTAIDFKHAADLVADKLYAERADLVMGCYAWMTVSGGFLVGDLVFIASLHDVVYTTGDWLRRHHPIVLQRGERGYVPVVVS
jgi:hypothetical protein